MEEAPRTDPTDELLTETARPNRDAAAMERSGHDASDDSVSQRAYRRYEERGREHGRDLDDWLEAERELTETNPE